MSEPDARLQPTEVHRDCRRGFATVARCGKDCVARALDFGPAPGVLRGLCQLIVHDGALVIRGRMGEGVLEKFCGLVKRIERHRAGRSTPAPQVGLRAVGAPGVVRRNSIHRVRRTRGENVCDPFVRELATRWAHGLEHRIHEQRVRKLVRVVILFPRGLEHRCRKRSVHGIEHAVGAGARGLDEHREGKGATQGCGGDENLHRGRGQAGQPASHQVRHASRQGQRGGDRPLPGRSAMPEDLLFHHRTHELRDEERIPLRVAEHEVEQVVAKVGPMQCSLQPLAHFRCREPFQPDLADALVARQPLATFANRTVRRLLAPDRECDADALRRELREHVFQGVPAGRIRPVHVLQRDQHGPGFAGAAQEGYELLHELVSLRGIEHAFVGRACGRRAQDRHEPAQQRPIALGRHAERVHAGQRFRPGPQRRAALAFHRAPRHDRGAPEPAFRQQLAYE